MLRNFWKLIGNAFEIARENLDACRVAVHLGANAVKLILDVNNPTGAFFDETSPNGIGGWLRSREHAFDRPKQ